MQLILSEYRRFGLLSAVMFGGQRHGDCFQGDGGCNATLEMLKVDEDGTRMPEADFEIF